MAWLDNRTIKLVLLGKRVSFEHKQADLTATFVVSSAKQKEFFKVLESYLDYCEKQGGFITEVEDILDAETNYKSGMVIKLSLHQPELYNGLRQHADSFIKNSESHLISGLNTNG